MCSVATGHTRAARSATLTRGVYFTVAAASGNEDAATAAERKITFTVTQRFSESMVGGQALEPSA